MWMITKMITSLASIFFPTTCYVCHKEGESFCVSCLSKIQKVIDPSSPSISSTYSFKEPVIKRAVHAIKYFHRKDLIEPLSRSISEDIMHKNYGAYILLPVPMPRLRRYVRGYNHAEAIASTISKQTGLPLQNDILIRIKSNKRQVLTRSREERLLNQRNTFTLGKDVRGYSIILIDDVTTTGATILEARKVLLEGGALSVLAYTIAH